MRRSRVEVALLEGLCFGWKVRVSVCVCACVYVCDVIGLLVCLYFSCDGAVSLCMFALVFI